MGAKPRKSRPPMMLLAGESAGKPHVDFLASWEPDGSLLLSAYAEIVLPPEAVDRLKDMLREEG